MDAGSNPSKKSPRSKKRRPRARRGQPGNRTPAAQIRLIEQSLASVAREVYGEMFGPHTDQTHPFPLVLNLSIEPDHQWQIKAHPTLEEQIRATVREMGTQAEAYQPGRVYCYRCDSSHCSHSIPPHPGSVFGGYSSTGLPLWPGLAQMLLDLKHPHVDLVYQRSAKELAVAYVAPEMLKHRQLNVFGKQSKTYDILGQVVCGFLRLPSAESGRGSKERVALTLQAVESRWLNGTPRLELNVLGRLSNGDAAVDALEGPYLLRVIDIIASTRQHLNALNPPHTKPEKQGSAKLPHTTFSRVTGHLKKLVRSLEKVGRQKERRTLHAEERRTSKRPTSAAWEDTLAAPDNLVLWDEHHQTVVVLGPRNRVHVFSPQGRHVTTLMIGPQAVQSRLRRKRWHQLQGEPLQRFRSSVDRISLNNARNQDRATTTGEPGPGVRKKTKSERNTADNNRKKTTPHDARQGPTKNRQEGKGPSRTGGARN